MRELWRSVLAARVTLNLDGVHGVINKGWLNLKQWVWRRRKSGERTLEVGHL
jgi:hypothetical protein